MAVKTTNDLVSSAFYLANVVSREFETVSGSQLSNGIDWLNEVLAAKDLEWGLIPFETTYTFIAQPGVEKYYIPNLIHIDTVAFYKDNVRFPMYETMRNQYFGSMRVESIKSLPSTYYFEREIGGGSLYLYFKPDTTYQFEIHGVFRLADVKLGQDLTLNVSQANLGVPKIYGDAVLSPGQLVVNNVDLAGNYLDRPGGLANYINSGIIPGIRAIYNGTDFILQSSEEDPRGIYIQTTGYPPNGTRFIQDVKLASTAALPTSTYSNGDQGFGAFLESASFGLLSIDGIALNLNDIVLIKDQVDQTQNGVYTVTNPGSPTENWVLTRALNYDKPYQIQQGDLFNVTSGLLNQFLVFVQNSDVVAIGISEISFIKFDALTFSNFSTIEFPNYEVFNTVGLDRFYLSFLKYALARKICLEYSYDIPPNLHAELNKYLHQMRNRHRVIDFRTQKSSTLHRDGEGVNWAAVNLWEGFWPN